MKSTFSPAEPYVIDSGFINTTLDVKFPKFTFVSATDLKVEFPKIKITGLLSLRLADISNHVAMDGVYVTEARNRLVIEVNDIGTKAASGIL